MDNVLPNADETVNAKQPRRPIFIKLTSSRSVVNITTKVLVSSRGEERVTLAKYFY